MFDDNFKELYFKIVDLYEIPPEVANEMIQRILEILSSNTSEHDFDLRSEWELDNL